MAVFCPSIQLAFSRLTCFTLICFDLRRSSLPEYVLIFAVTLLAAGCVSSAPRNTPLAHVEMIEGTDMEQMLRNEAADWSGTPHVWGGTSRSGIDCSALVQTVYKDLFNVSLPRTTAQQSTIGQPVQQKDIRTGDLVFYRIDAGTRHVGIYLGNNEFFHASKSQGVTISSIDDPYWEKRFWMMRRIIHDARETEPSATPQKRVSW